MINFASLFNQFRNSSNSVINDLLEQPNTDLARLLDQDSFVNQYKSGNNKLLDFMKYQKFAQLVEYVTVVGPADDRKRSYKFPLSASQVLSCESNTIVDLFFPETQIFVDEVTYEDQEFQVQIDEQLIDSSDQQTKKEETSSDVPPKTIIQEDLEADVTSSQNTPQKVISEGEQVGQIQDKKINSSGEKKDQSPKEKKKIKEIRKVEKINKKPVEPLIGKLFQYFLGEINYTLAGYVCKILLAMITKKPNLAINYILLPDKRAKVLNHIESRSVCDLIIRIMSFQSTDFLKERTEFYNQIIKKLSINAEIFVLSNLSACANQIIQKSIANLKGNNPIKEFAKLFFSPEDITSVIVNVMSEDQNVSVYNSQILLTYLTNIPLNAPQNQQLLLGFEKILQLFVDKASEKLAVTKNQRKVLGFGRIKILQIISFILKENILNSQDLIGKKNGFFKILISLCQNYQMNNILHNQIVKIFDIALQSGSESILLSSLLQRDLLLNFIYQQYKQDVGLKPPSKKVRKGYIGHVMLIVNKIRQYSSKNVLLEKVVNRTEFQSLIVEWVQKQTYEASKDLGGYSSRKNLPQKIMFQKQEIIAQYIKFLSNCPVAVIDEQQPIETIHPDLIQELQRELEDNLKISEEEPKPEELKPEVAEPINHRYWVKHLQYDIEELMESLL